MANDWLEDDDSIISEADFINRISLSELSVDFDGDFSAYYDDDDMFAGHRVSVFGNIKTGLESASING